MKILCIQIYAFLKNPKDENKRFSVKEELIFIIQCFILYFIFAILSSIPITLLRSMDLTPIHKSTVINMELSVYLVLIIPIIEEIIFRSWLRISKINTALFFGTILFIIIRKRFDLHLFFEISIPLLAASIIYATLHFKFNLSVAATWMKNHIKLFYYLSFIIFAIVHLQNFNEISVNHIPFLPFIIINQLFMGILLGYARLTRSYGLLLSIALHFTINLPILILSHL